MLAGAPIFKARTAHEMVAAHMSELPAPIGTLRTDTPPELAALVMQCVAKNPAERPASANAVLATLDSLGGAAAPRNTRRTFAIYAACFVVAVVVARLAIDRIGLPSWVFAATLIVMALGFPGVFLLAPRQVLRGGILAGAGLVVVVAGYMAMRALGIGPAGSLFGKGVLKERDGIVVTDFRVVNADSTFGAMFSEAVRMGLSQSDVLTIESGNDVRDALKMMGRDAAIPLDLAGAREVAVRLRAKAVVDGDISGVAGGYLVSLRIVTADSGIQLASFHAAADGPRGLIQAADSLARQLRAKSGESLRQVRSTPELYWQTTGSIDALHEFTTGVAWARQGDLDKAIAHYRAAVAIRCSPWHGKTSAPAFASSGCSMPPILRKSAPGTCAIT